MHFDTAPRTLRSLNSIMRRDPRVIRWTVLKLGAKVEDIAKEGQKAQKGASLEASDLVT
jgi:small subunit ribosomal protein S6